MSRETTILNSSPVPLLLLLGPSGAGKSTLGIALAKTHNWLHVEIDPLSYAAGGVPDFAHSWRRLCLEGRFADLASQMQRQAIATSRQGVVAAFESMATLTIEQIATAGRSGLAVVYLFGTEAECLGAFLRREAQIGRRLPETHWRTCNAEIYGLGRRPEYEPHKLHAFRDGARRPIEELVAEMQARVRRSSASEAWTQRPDEPPRPVFR